MRQGKFRTLTLFVHIGIEFVFALYLCPKLPQGHRPKHSWKGIDVESCADSIAPVIPCLNHHLLYLCPVCVLEACAIHCMPWLLKHQFLNHPFPCRHCSPRMTPLNTQFQKVIYILTIPRFRLGSSYFDQTFTIGDPELDDAKICRNPLYFMVKTMGFQLTSHQNLSIETLIHRFTYDIFYN